MKSSSIAKWQGAGKTGSGTLTSKQKVLNETPYDFRSRFEDGTYTNPEELIAAAHAGCFAMKLSFVLGEAGFTPDSLEAECTITMDGGAITESHIDLKASIPGISEEVFQQCAANAKENCPVSKLLNTTITLSATLA